VPFDQYCTDADRISSLGTTEKSGNATGRSVTLDHRSVLAVAFRERGPSCVIANTVLAKVHMA